MAKTKKGDKRTKVSIMAVYSDIRDRHRIARGVFRTEAILQPQNKLTEFTVLHYNCDHSSCNDYGPVIVDPTY
jgi:hypothetical protein